MYPEVILDAPSLAGFTEFGETIVRNDFDSWSDVASKTLVPFMGPQMSRLIEIVRGIGTTHPDVITAQTSVVDAMLAARLNRDSGRPSLDSSASSDGLSDESSGGSASGNGNISAMSCGKPPQARMTPHFAMT